MLKKSLRKIRKDKENKELGHEEIWNILGTALENATNSWSLLPTFLYYLIFKCQHFYNVNFVLLGLLFPCILFQVVTSVLPGLIAILGDVLILS